MTSKARKRDQVVDEIRARWRPIEFTAAWAALPADRRARVLAEFEESARELRDSEPVLATDILTALDALESVPAAVALSSAHTASADIETLIALLEEPDGR